MVRIPLALRGARHTSRRRGCKTRAGAFTRRPSPGVVGKKTGNRVEEKLSTPDVRVETGGPGFLRPASGGRRNHETRRGSTHIDPREALRPFVSRMRPAPAGGREQDLDYEAFLLLLLEQEGSATGRQGTAEAAAGAQFPLAKSLDEFDMSRLANVSGSLTLGPGFRGLRGPGGRTLSSWGTPERVFLEDLSLYGLAIFCQVLAS